MKVASPIRRWLAVFSAVFWRIGYQGEDKHLTSKSLLLSVTLLLLSIHMGGGALRSVGDIQSLLLITAPFLLFSYFLSTTRYYILAAWLMNAIFLALFFVIALSDKYTELDLIMSVIYLTIATLLMSNILSFRHTHVLLVSEFLVFTGLFLFVSEMNASELLTVISIGIIVVIFILVLARIQKKYDQDILSYQDSLETLVSQKDDLLKEVYHRTKNNMQTISSLLDLQMQYSSDPETIEAFKITQDRIRSMSLVHKKLYQSKNLNEVCLKEYLEDLAEELITSYVFKQGQINFKIEGDSIRMTLERIIPVGMVVNELLTNALKYAFPDGRQGEISVHISEFFSGQIEVCIIDNGIGLPLGFYPQTGDTLGFKLIYNITELQLNGSCKIYPVERGTKISLQFSAI